MSSPFAKVSWEAIRSSISPATAALQGTGCHSSTFQQCRSVPDRNQHLDRDRRHLQGELLHRRGTSVHASDHNPKPTSERPSPITQVPAIGVGITQVDKLNLAKFTLINLSVAEGGVAIENRNKNVEATAKGIFTGESGPYRVKITYFDGNDGASLPGKTSMRRISDSPRERPWRSTERATRTISCGSMLFQSAYGIGSQKPSRCPVAPNALYRARIARNSFGAASPTDQLGKSCSTAKLWLCHSK